MELESKALHKIIRAQQRQSEFKFAVPKDMKVSSACNKNQPQGVYEINRALALLENSAFCAMLSCVYAADSFLTESF